MVGDRLGHIPGETAAHLRDLRAAERPGVGGAGRLRVVGRLLGAKRPIGLVDAADSVTARPPAIHRIAGSRPRRSASFTSS
jgi:hypothetical protein